VQLSSYRFSDYRLAAYVVVAALIAGGATFAFDRLTAPSSKLEANSAPAAAGAVRQIPIARTTAADIGDPDGKLTPVYPTSPGKDLPVKDTSIKPASTTGSASGPTASPAVASTNSQTASPQAAQIPVTPQAANSCDVAACASAYRSFRESDCSYQPFEGPRRLCEGAPGANAPNGQAATLSPNGQTATLPPGQPISRSRYDNDLRDAERAVRRLPPPGVGNDDEDSIVVVQPPDRSRYDLRRNWFNEQ
jgi:hypothetical protein